MPFRNDQDSVAQRCATLGRQLAEIEARAHELEELREQAAAVRRELAAAQRLLEAMQQKRSLPLLADLRVASPCKADWSQMVGDDRVRFCGECQKNVYNLSQLTREEGERLVREREGRLCVRFYRRSDGTMLTADCPVGLRRTRFRKLALGGVVGLGLLGAGAVWAASMTQGSRIPVQGTLPPAPPAIERQAILGEPALPPPNVPVVEVTGALPDPLPPARR